MVRVPLETHFSWKCFQILTNTIDIVIKVGLSFRRIVCWNREVWLAVSDCLLEMVLGLLGCAQNAVQ